MNDRQAPARRVFHGATAVQRCFVAAASCRREGGACNGDAGCSTGVEFGWVANIPHAHASSTIASATGYRRYGVRATCRAVPRSNDRPSCPNVDDRQCRASVVSTSGSLRAIAPVNASAQWFPREWTSECFRSGGILPPRGRGMQWRCWVFNGCWVRAGCEYTSRTCLESHCFGGRMPPVRGCGQAPGWSVCQVRAGCLEHRQSQSNRPGHRVRTADPTRVGFGVLS